MDEQAVRGGLLQGQEAHGTIPEEADEHIVQLPDPFLKDHRSHSRVAMRRDVEPAVIDEGRAGDAEDVLPVFPGLCQGKTDHPV